MALIGALDSLTPGRMTPHEVALAAQRIETDMLGQQCGIQDQLCSAYGGINYIEMYQYPHASVSPIQVPNSTWWELERRLVLIYLGKSHHSSPVHEMVIRGSKMPGRTRQLDDLRQTAPRSRDAVYAGDFAAPGPGDDRQHRSPAPPAPRSDQPEARTASSTSPAHGALGWKVNGAGGEGGSVTILCGDFRPPSAP